MCGIAGIYSLSGEVKAPLLVDKIKYRGPDSKGEWYSKDGRVWFGHVRLAIIDLSPTGYQPMIDGATGDAIVFNGEIYNHIQIRNHQRLQGIKWQGTSDTETVLAGYSIFGEGIVPMLKGMFAFGIWDNVNKRFFACRDRFGMKPFYYTYRNNIFSFSSETKILEDEAISKKGLGNYLRYGCCQDDELILKGINTLPSGCTLIINAMGKIDIKRYWPTAIESKKDFSLEEAQAQLSKLLEISVKEHLISDVPVASFLSGGLDSSIITALAAKSYSGRLKTFSLGFSQKAFDETVIAKEVADKYSTEHTRIELRSDEVIEWVKESVLDMDLPSVDAINTYIVAKAVHSARVKLALTGLGGDELFGGYVTFRDAPCLRLLSQLPAFIGKGFARFNDKFERVEAVAGQHISLQAAALARRIMTPDEDLESLRLDITPFQTYEHPFKLDGFGEISWAELRGYMQNMLLRDSDQMSMALSLEIRVPFLDHQLVEFILTLPERIKRPTPQTKSLLVETFKDILPRQVYKHPKQGFLLPMDAWLRNELLGFSKDGLSKAVRHFPHFKDFIDISYEKFLNRRLSWTRIWVFVVLGHWLANRRIKGGEGL